MKLVRYLSAGYLLLACFLTSAAEPAPADTADVSTQAPLRSVLGPSFQYIIPDSSPTMPPPLVLVQEKSSQAQPVPTPTPTPTPTPAPPPPPPPADSFAQAPPPESPAPASYAPHLFGDFFGSPAKKVVIQQAPIIIPGMPGSPAVTHTLGGTFLSFQTSNPATFTSSPVFGPGTFSPLSFTLMGPATLPGVNFTFQPPLTHLSQGTVVVPSQGLSSGAMVTLQEQTMVRQQTLLSATSQFGPGGTLTLTQSNATLVSPLDESEQFADWTIASLYNYVIPGTPGTPAQVIPRASIILDLPSPTGGGVVGRTKIAEDNSPLPTDRVFFNYDYFDNVPLTTQPIGVHRFSPGFEKTFFDQRASIEVRVPFASTAATDILADGVNGGGHSVLGNVNVTLKGLVYSGPLLNVAVGVGIAIPTAPDETASLLDGTKLVQIKNDSVVLTPYLAYLYTPNDRLFMQNWFQYSFGANGNQVLANPDFTGLVNVGTLTDQPLVQLDAQVGYWLYRSNTRSDLLRGLAPFLELHYNATTGKSDSIQAGMFSLGDANSQFNELNLTAGLTLQLGDNFDCSVGAVLPLLGNNDRSLDWQLGIRGSWYFGPTARSREAAAGF